MKRIISLILCAALLLSVPITVNADGDGNMDNGGGDGMGNGSDDSYWNDDDGVRVTVIRASDNKPVSVPFDLTNYNENSVKRSQTVTESEGAVRADPELHHYARPYSE